MFLRIRCGWVDSCVVSNMQRGNNMGVAYVVMSQAEGRAGGEPDRDGDSG